MAKNDRFYVRKLTLTALFLACGLLLPQFFHLIGAGTVFLPMHLPVLLCGFVCGWQWGLLCGALTPLLSSLLTGMPPIFPVGASMICELAVYGGLCGLFGQLLQGRKAGVYLALVAAMLAGRLVGGLTDLLFYGVAGSPYSMEAFLSAKFITSLPGIILQLLLVPPLVLAIRKLQSLPQAARGGAHE